MTMTDPRGPHHHEVNQELIIFCPCLDSASKEFGQKPSDFVAKPTSRELPTLIEGGGQVKLDQL